MTFHIFGASSPSTCLNFSQNKVFLIMYTIFCMVMEGVLIDKRSSEFQNLNLNFDLSIGRALVIVMLGILLWFCVVLKWCCVLLATVASFANQMGFIAPFALLSKTYFETRFNRLSWMNGCYITRSGYKVWGMMA